MTKISGQLGALWFGPSGSQPVSARFYHSFRLSFWPDPFCYYVGLKLIETRIPFDDGLFNYHLTSIEIILCHMNDNRTNLYLLSL